MQRIAGQPETTTPPNEEAAWSGALVILDVVAPTAPKLPKQHQGFYTDRADAFKKAVGQKHFFSNDRSWPKAAIGPRPASLGFSFELNDRPPP